MGLCLWKRLSEGIAQKKQTKIIVSYIDIIAPFKAIHTDHTCMSESLINKSKFGVHAWESGI